MTSRATTDLLLTLSNFAYMPLLKCKKHFIILILIPIVCFGQRQDEKKGKVIIERFTASSLQNSGGENPIRRVTIYLPPDYDKTSNRYPVIYYLHGFTNSDSITMIEEHFDQVLDKAIAMGKIRPVIVVIPNQYTLFRGSWYTNSPLTGNWADFTAKDLVSYMDQHFRTIPLKESRGLTGHSMGGHGAIKTAMLYPDVFPFVYALSPTFLAIAKEIDASGSNYKRIQQIKTREELVKGGDHFIENAIVAFARASSPNANNAPFFADLPFTYNKDSLIVNAEVLELWNKNLPVSMIDTYADNLRKLKAIKLDWGRNDWASHVPITCLLFSQKLEGIGIHHDAEEFLGNHEDKLWTDDGRALNEMLPFFNSYLTFQKLTYTDQQKKM